MFHHIKAGRLNSGVINYEIQRFFHPLESDEMNILFNGGKNAKIFSKPQSVRGQFHFCCHFLIFFSSIVFFALYSHYINNILIFVASYKLDTNLKFRYKIKL